ncbi:hypothetical protein D915_010712 [Fasciola hepatica]|uniref:Uncharacterized protein n=1 Tax=Fasciola hepatica TaxID=6192 RepID=A0A4E0QUL2_FASHE|nr:hypothetical protein D915_010712 [Fasciola hepatica]
MKESRRLLFFLTLITGGSQSFVRLCFAAVFSKEQFLRFLPTSSPEKEVYYYESPGSVSPIEINASVSQQVRIRISDYLANEIPKLLLRCLVEELADDAALVTAYLCRRVRSEPNCNND